MEKGSFTLHRSSVQQRPQSNARPPTPALRRATTPGAPAVEIQSRFSAPRFFSVCEETTRANAEKLAHAADHMDDPPAYIRDDSRMHRPNNSPRFGALRTASREGPDIELDNQTSFDHSQLGSSTDESESTDRAVTDESDSDEQNGGYSHHLSQIPAVSRAQEFIDVMWEIEKAPMVLQECFGTLKEEALRNRKALLKEKKTAVKLSRDIEALEREAKALRAEKKEHELQLCAQEDALHNEVEKVESLRGDLQKLRVESKRTKQTFANSQQNMNKELDKLSKDFSDANGDLQRKDKELSQLRREFVRVKKDMNDEVKLRESAAAESQAFKQELFELRKRYNEEKRSQKDNKERITKLEELNKTVTSKASALEQTVEKQDEANQILENELLDVLVFVRSICGVVQDVYEATCAHGSPGLPEVLALPELSCFRIDECCVDYEVFKELFESLNACLSTKPILHLADAHEEALRKLFAILVLRDAAHSRYICASDSELTRMQEDLKQLREHFEEARQPLKELHRALSSELCTLRQRTPVIIDALIDTSNELEEERLKTQEEYERLRESHLVLRDKFNISKKDLVSKIENLIEDKKQLQADIQEGKKQHSKEACQKNSLWAELQKAEATIKNLNNAASVAAKMQHETEVSLTRASERVQTLLTERKTHLEKLSKCEADLRQAKEELERSSRVATADGEKNKRRVEVLNHEVQMLIKEKNDALMRATEAEFGVRQMSNKITEAFAAKQKALEELVLAKNRVEELQSQLEKASGKDGYGQVGKQVTQTVMPNVLGKDVRKRQSTDTLDSDDSEWKQKASTDGQQPQHQRSSPAMNPGSSSIPQGDSVGYLRREVVPKKLKRRTPIRKSPKNPRQKRTRSNSQKPATAAVGVTRRDSKPKSAPQETRVLQDIGPQTSSASETVRDDNDWIVESALLPTPE